MRTLMIPVHTRRALASDLFSQMNREFDRLFEDFNGSFQGESREVNSMNESWAQASSFEAEDHFLVSVDLPGTKREDIKIEVLEGVMTVSGERKDANPQRHSTFRRSFVLPRNVKAESVDAHYEDGVLKLYLPKVEAARPRQVEIQSGKTGFWENLLGSKPTQPEVKNIDPKH